MLKLINTSSLRPLTCVRFLADSCKKHQAISYGNAHFLEFIDIRAMLFENVEGGERQLQLEFESECGSCRWVHVFAGQDHSARKRFVVREGEVPSVTGPKAHVVQNVFCSDTFCS